VAWTARQLGLRAVIFMTARASPHRIEAIRREGAEVRLVDGSYEAAVATCAAESAAHGWQVVADVGYDDYLEIPRWITAGYSTILGEYEDQRAAAGYPPADVVLAQAGVGGFAAAVLEHFRHAPRSRVVIVEPVDADPLLESSLTPDGRPAESTGSQRTIMAGLNCSRVSESAWPVIRAGADLFLSVADHWALDAMRRYANPVAGDPIVVAGESGAAGLAGLLALVEHPPFADARRHLGLGPESTVLLIVTEGDTDPESWARIVAAARRPSGQP
jgi:diaminopropionate ammonia-lyase